MKKIIQTACIISTILGIASYLPAQNSSEMTGTNEITTVELTSFQLIEGADEAKFLQAADQMQKAFLDKQEGFVKRTIVKGEHGWTDIVFWKDPQSMQNAMQKAESAAEVAPFMQMIDFSSVKMNLTEIKMNSN